jgi:hypothetical protein
MTNMQFNAILHTNTIVAMNVRDNDDKKVGKYALLLHI